MALIALRYKPSSADVVSSSCRAGWFICPAFRAQWRLTPP